MLHVVHRVEHDHPGDDRHLIRDLCLLAIGHSFEHAQGERLAGESAGGECRLGGGCDRRGRLIDDGHYFLFLVVPDRAFLAAPGAAALPATGAPAASVR